MATKTEKGIILNRLGRLYREEGRKPESIKKRLAGLHKKTAEQIQTLYEQAIFTQGKVHHR